MALFSQPTFSTLAKATGGRYDPTTASGNSQLRQDILKDAQRAEAFRNAASAVQEQKALQAIQAETARPSQEVAPGRRAVVKDGKVVGYSQPLENAGPSKIGGTSQPFEKGFLAALQKAQPSKAAPTAAPEQVTETVTEKVTEKPMAAPTPQAPAPQRPALSFSEAARQAMGKAETGQKASAAQQAGTRMQELQALVSTLQDPAQIEKAAADFAEAEAQAALNTMTDAELQEFIRPAVNVGTLGGAVKGQGFLGSLGATAESGRLGILDAVRNLGSNISSGLFGGTPAKPSRELLEFLVRQAAKNKAMEAIGQKPSAVPSF